MQLRSTANPTPGSTPELLAAIFEDLVGEENAALCEANEALRKKNEELQNIIREQQERLSALEARTDMPVVKDKQAHEEASSPSVGPLGVSAPAAAEPPPSSMVSIAAKIDSLVVSHEELASNPVTTVLAEADRADTKTKLDVLLGEPVAAASPEATMPLPSIPEAGSHESDPQSEAAALARDPEILSSALPSAMPDESATLRQALDQANGTIAAQQAQIAQQAAQLAELTSALVHANKRMDDTLKAHLLLAQILAQQAQMIAQQPQVAHPARRSLLATAPTMPLSHALPPREAHESSVARLGMFAPVPSLTEPHSGLETNQTAPYHF